MYESYITVVDLLASISKILEGDLLSILKASTYFSLMADESTDVSLQEEVSVCAQWLHNKKKQWSTFLGSCQQKRLQLKLLLVIYALSSSPRM